MSEFSVAKKRFGFRKARVRNKISGTSERPRLTVSATLKHIYAQIVDDTQGITLAAASTLSPELKGKMKSSGNKEAAGMVGQLIADKAKQKSIAKVVFDRGGRPYHGRVKELAEAVRKNGLQF
ncbi:MAG: 50S ribosomal protein L18 [Elusimicrobiota bacterium]